VCKHSCAVNSGVKSGVKSVRLRSETYVDGLLSISSRLLVTATSNEAKEHAESKY
jgi:hypothetical protein